MTVEVQPPPRPPTLTGDPKRDLEAFQKWAGDMWRTVYQMRERTGGQTDLIASTQATATTAAATASASQAGATIPTEGGLITLTPADPLSKDNINQGTARITVTGHTRTGAGAPLIGADVSPDVARGEDATYYVYYSDAGDLGGAQTYLATTDLATVTGTAGYRIIGTISCPPPNYPARVTG
jgi:hypothetical protein